MKKLICILLVLGSLALLACSANTTGNSQTDSNASTKTQDQAVATPEPTPEPLKSGTRRNPFKFNETAFFDGMDSIFDTYKAELTLNEVIRGEEAWELIKNGNPFNEEPPENKEYMLARFKIKILESKDDAVVDINNAIFDFVSGAGIKYSDFVSISGVEPSLKEIYAGSETEGFAYMLIDLGDSPVIVFKESINGGLWFATN